MYQRQLPRPTREKLTQLPILYTDAKFKTKEHQYIKLRSTLLYMRKIYTVYSIECVFLMNGFEDCICSTYTTLIFLKFCTHLTHLQRVYK